MGNRWPSGGRGRSAGRVSEGERYAVAHASGSASTVTPSAPGPATPPSTCRRPSRPRRPALPCAAPPSGRCGPAARTPRRPACTSPAPAVSTIRCSSLCPTVLYSGKSSSVTRFSSTRVGGDRLVAEVERDAIRRRPADHARDQHRGRRDAGEVGVLRPVAGVVQHERAGRTLDAGDVGHPRVDREARRAAAHESNTFSPAVLKPSYVLLPHRVEDSTLNRLEPVAHVRQRTRGDDRQRVVQISRLSCFVERDAGAVRRSAAARRTTGGRRWSVAAVIVRNVEERGFRLALGHERLL